MCIGVNAKTIFHNLIIFEKTESHKGVIYEKHTF